MNAIADALIVGISSSNGLVQASNLEKKVVEQVQQLWKSSRGKRDSLRVFYNVEGYQVVAAVDVPTHEKSWQRAQFARMAAAKAVKGLEPERFETIAIDTLGNTQGAAEGAVLGSWGFNRYRTFGERSKKPPIKFQPIKSSSDWDMGVLTAEAQNHARDLMETPANLLTPKIFGEKIAAACADVPGLKATIHDEKWIESQKMGGVCGVAQGSCNPPRFAEIHYTGASSDSQIEYAFVGKGITFDSGGISIKASPSMSSMRADMGGAAVVLATVLAAAKLGLKKNISVFIPIAENLPSGSAQRPGDIITMRNGMTVDVDNTDAEGRLILADGLHYCSAKFKPKKVISVATLTYAIIQALGDVFTGVFAESDTLWQELERAGQEAGDPFWRMPFAQEYLQKISKTNADLCNNVLGGAGSCTAAVFLQMFVSGGLAERASLSDSPVGESKESPSVTYAHIDIAGTFEASLFGGEKGMTGRPTRSLIKFLQM